MPLRYAKRVFIDEMSVTTKMVRYSGRAPRGERTVKEFWRLIGKLVKSFAPEECANYFRHTGYRR